MNANIFRLHPIAFGIVAVLSAPTFALPTAPTVASGSATFQQAAGSLTITNTPNAIINWGSFSIGQNEFTKFIQQSSTSTVLNRVIGQNPSQILGQLQSNGRVFLINPNGILFGAGSRIDTAGLVASTLNITDADLLAGRLKFTGTGLEGKVENQGTITTPNGGQIYLIAPNVENSGIINAPNGDILLTAGQSVEITDSLNPALRVQITSPEGQVTNLGQILAESGRIGLHGGMVSNSGTVSASSAIAEGGKIYLRATNKIELTETSKLGADGTAGGEITAITIKDGQIAGELVARGEISAQGNGSAGSGGFVETSASTVTIVDGFLVKTRGGEWLIDPADFTIAASGGNITGATLSSNINSSTGGGITILSSSGTAGGNGDINVNDAVSWSANNLTLTAARDININAVMTASGTSTLTMNTASAASGEAAVAGGTVRVGLNPDGTFKGRVDFLNGAGAPRSGTGFLTINGQGYTVIQDANALQNTSSGLAGYYALGSNFSASSIANFVPIGTFSTPFTGQFDGLGHTITGLTINRPSTDYVGLFGATNGATLRNLGLANASITGFEYVGSLVGGAVNIALHNSYASSVTVTGDSYVGGLVGNVDQIGSDVSVVIDHTYTTGTVTGFEEVGGLIGSTYSGYGETTAIKKSYSSASIGGTTYYSVKHGGLIGSLGEYSSIADSYATGSITAGDGSYIIGGLVGYRDWYASVSASYATGSISSGNNSQNVGGLIGIADVGGSVSQSYASGSITVGNNSHDIGGVIGWNNGPAVTDVYAIGAVTTGTNSYDIGGLVGENGGVITRAYSSGIVTVGAGSTTVGGLVGNLYTFSGGTVTNGYWNINTSGQATSNGGTPLTTAQMKDSGNFSSWDFTNVWNIDAGVSYPYLRNPEQIPHPPLVAATTCSTCSWTGLGGNTLWSTTGNWTGNLLPGAGATVTIGSGFTGGIVFDVSSLSLASITVSSPLEIQSGKTLTLSGAGTLYTGGYLKGSGTLVGNLINTGGTVGPGSSPGTLNITGNYTQGSSGTLLIELGGLTQGASTNGYDYLNISGTATLDGTLQLALYGGFVPAVGNSFTPINAAGGRFGNFANVLPPSTSYNFSTSYGAYTVTLDLTSITAPPVAPSGSTNPVTTTVTQINNTVNLGALSYETPLLYASGQSSNTASTSGGFTQTAETVLPVLIPDLITGEGTGTPQTPAFAAIMPLVDRLIFDANRQEWIHESRLVCR